MRAPALAEAAAHLSWLSPSAASLVALTRADAATTWAEVRSDPGCVLLVVRQAGVCLASPALSFFPSLLHDSSNLVGALRHLEQPHPPCIDWNNPLVLPTYQACLDYARLAFRIAEQTGRADPENAWVAGLLAPLGWLAVCAIDPGLANEVRSQITEFKLPIGYQAGPANQQSAICNLQSKIWGLDQSAIARRLGHRWRLPAWLVAISGHLSLRAETADGLGADPELFRVVQLAVAVAQQQDIGLGLAVGEPAEANAAALGLCPAELQALQAVAPRELTEHHRSWQTPGAVPLLGDLLRLAAENRRLAETPIVERLEAATDRLQRALEEQSASESHRLRDLKLAALAEFAAGAGHEINNPLAVISGQAQYVLKQLQIADCRLQIAPEGPVVSEHTAEEQSIGNLRSKICNSQEVIVKQTQRIHQILNELMYFARPPKPQKQIVDLGVLIHEVATALTELAIERQIRLICRGPDQGVLASVDSSQIRMALTCLLRNAIQAAPADGWAGVRLETATPQRVEIIVEDSGDGPTERQRQHLFDPFYSGRQAGRGRGLGLPTAWRLARENDGDLWFDAASGSPTRFVLALPRESARRESHVDAAVNNGPTTNGWNTPDAGIPRTDPLSRLPEIEPVSPAEL